MKNKGLLIGGVLLLVSSLMIGCGGIPQEQYDALVAERDAAEEQVASMQTEIEQLQDENDALKQECTKLRRFRIVRIGFCSEKVESPTEFKPKPDNIFGTGDVVWLYFDAINFENKVVNHTFEVNVESVTKVIDSEGKAIDAPLTVHEAGEQPYGIVSFNVSVTDVKPGDYIIELVVKDNISEETVSWEGEFRVTPS